MNRELAEKQGRRAETLAAWWLTFRGWRVVAKRMRTPYSEVDLLALRGRVLALVEVKRRATWEACEDALDWSTRRRLDRACEWVEAHNRLAKKREVRVDAVYVVGWRVRHVPEPWRYGD